MTGAIFAGIADGSPGGGRGDPWAAPMGRHLAGGAANKDGLLALRSFVRHPILARAKFWKRIPKLLVFTGATVG